MKGDPGSSVRNASRLGLAVRKSSADIVHLVGTNALVFSPICKLFRRGKRIVRHIFTSYDRTDKIIRPARRVVNSFFVDAYAFTSPWIGEWEHDLSSRTRRFLFRPPIDCELYAPVNQPSSSVPSERMGRKTILYMGPLLRSRFPMVPVLGGLKELVRRGTDAGLVILTSAIRTSHMQCETVLALARSLDLQDRVVLKRVDLSESQRVQAYNESDTVIFPFIGPEPEKLADPPFGLLEAMACGRIVLATNVLSIPEIVEDGETGYLISEASIEQIQAGLHRALASPWDERVQTNARRRIIRDFSYPEIRRRVMDTYQAFG